LSTTTWPEVQLRYRTQARAIELEPHYVDVAVKRWQIFTGKVATLAATGESFEDVAEKRCCNVALASSTDATESNSITQALT
jgi:hypothetical protein